MGFGAWGRQIDEIRDDCALRIYGALLAFLQVLSVGYWLTSRTDKWLVADTEAICWPMFENCQKWRWLGPTGIKISLLAFLLTGLVTMALFASRKNAGKAWLALLLLNIAKLFILALDDRLRMNHHLMAFWVTFAFLFLPEKRNALRLLIVLFYAWAGTLKLNHEWLSGSALYGPLWFFHGQGVLWACTYVVGLELVFIWALWLNEHWMAKVTWLQLMLFHTFSFPIVGYFYPLLMYAILAIYPLGWWFKKEGDSGVGNRLIRADVTAAAIAVAVAFCIFQIIPRAIPGDTALTGEGRLFALNMFDARSQCEITARLKYADGQQKMIDLHIALPVRLHCDPVIYLSRVRAFCREEAGRSENFVDLDWQLRSRRTSESAIHRVVDTLNVCRSRLRYAALSKNEWVNGRD